jgi:hypothetical protein
MAEKTITTPADIIHDIRVGEIMPSSVFELDRTALRLFFACRSLLCSRAFLLAMAACFGDDGGLREDPDTGARGYRVVGESLVGSSLSSVKWEPGTNRKVVG